jgi:hypothetical protein
MRWALLLALPLLLAACGSAGRQAAPKGCVESLEVGRLVGVGIKGEWVPQEPVGCGRRLERNRVAAVERITGHQVHGISCTSGTGSGSAQAPLCLVGTDQSCRLWLFVPGRQPAPAEDHGHPGRYCRDLPLP